MWISKKKYQNLVEGKENGLRDAESELEYRKERIDGLLREVIKLEKLIPYEQLLKQCNMKELTTKAMREYGISQRVLNECDDKADLINKILYAKRDLDRIKPL